MLEVIHQHLADPLHLNRIRQVRSQRMWRWITEPALNGMGNVLGWGVRAGGLPGITTFQAWLFARLIHNPPQPLDPASHSAIEAAIQLAETLRVAGGAWPCVLFATSHPRAADPPQHLLFELYRQAFAVNQRLSHQDRGKPDYLRIVLAVDSFALEGVPPEVAAVYTGLVHVLHLSLDRQPSQQSWFQRHVGLRGSASWAAGFRLLRAIQRPGGVALAWAGAEPQNARLLYTTREFISRIGRQLKLPPSQRWALLNRVVAFLLAEGSADSGLVSQDQRARLQALLQESGLHAEEVHDVVNAFCEEFQREVPYRERLVETVIARLLRHGRSVLLIPLRHRRADGKVYVSLPEGLHGSPATGLKRFLFSEGGALHTEAVSDLRTFARGFVKRGFPEDRTS
ncbi:MAG: hypothetical protein HYZ73_03280 [Elusimicrobia bacterium]|nr:hypothetical protein [Elusimicrobiota bacterium]